MPYRLLPRVLVVVLPLAFLLLLGTWQVASDVTTATIRTQVLDRLDLTAHHSAAQISARLRMLQETAAGLADNDLIINALANITEDQPHLKTLFRSLRIPGPVGTHISVLDYRGRPLATNGEAPSYENAPWIYTVMTGESHLQMGTDGVLVAEPVMVQGLPEGIIVISYGQEDMPAFLAIDTGAEETVVLDSAGTVIYSTDQGLAAAGILDMDIGPTGWLTAATPIPDVPRLTLVTAVSEDKAFAAVAHVEKIMLLAVALSIAGLIGGIVLATYLTTKPLSKLIGSIREIENATDLGHRARPAGSAEFDELAESFNQMVERLEKTTTSRDRVDKILRSMSDILIVTDRDGRIEFANRAALQSLDCTADEIKGRSIAEVFLDGESREPHPSLAPEAVVAGVQSVEAVCLSSSGEGIPVLVSASAVDQGEAANGEDDGDEEEGLIYVAQDITERKKVEKALGRVQRRLSTAIESISEAFALFNSNDRLILFNSKFREVYKDSADVIRIGTRFEDIVRVAAERGQYAGVAGDVESYVQMRVAQHRNPQGPIEEELSDGRWLRIQEWRTAEGGIVGIRTDVTELKRREAELRRQAHELELANAVLKGEIDLRKATEASLRDSELKARAVFEGATDGILTLDENGLIESLNPAAESIFSHEADGMVGMDIRNFIPEAYRRPHDWNILSGPSSDQPRLMGGSWEVYGQHSDGTEFPVEWTVSPLRLGDRHLFTGIVRDITERRKIEDMKNEFISTVSHELRTPLTSIQGSLGLMRGGIVGDLSEKAQKMVEIAYNNCERLVRLINDILDIERIETGKLRLDLRPIDFQDLVEEAIEANKGYTQRLGVELAIRGELPDVAVTGDRDRLLQVFANLISNAAKFAPAGSEVLIAATEAEERLRVSVIDSGPGIPEGFQGRIFQKFAQADSSDSRQKSGTGLGLNITKTIVELHDGEIGFTTEAGKGTEFHFDLPVRAPAAVRSSEAIAAAVAADRSLPRVLVCEDDPDVAQVLSAMLQSAGYATDIAYTATQARTLLASIEYAAMTLDLILPDQDGLWLIRELRRNSATMELPVVVVSAAAREGAEKLGGEAVNIIDWLDKPIDEKRLRAALRRAIRRANVKLPRILHVEDDADLQSVVSELLGEAGKIGEITGAATRQEAERLLKEQTFDLVILDLMLPDGAGEDLLPLLNGPGRPATPVIVFSARELAADAASIHAVLVKSQSSNDELLAVVRATIEARIRTGADQSAMTTV